MKYLAIPIAALLLSVSPGQPGRVDGNEARMLKKWKLVEYLALTEDQSTKFFPRVEIFERAMEDVRKEERRLYEDIEGDIQRGDDFSSSELRDMLKKYRELDQNALQLKHNHFSGMEDILTPTQIAKYAIFEQKFRKRMMENIEKRQRDFPGRNNNNRF